MKEQKRKTDCLHGDGEKAEGEDRSKVPKLESNDAGGTMVETPESASAEPPAPKKPKRRAVRAKNGEAASFARRPCPSSFPSKQRWHAIKSIFHKHVRPWLRDLGFTMYKYEALIV